MKNRVKTQSAYGDICHGIIKSHANFRQHTPNPKHSEEVIQKDDSSALFVKASYSPDLRIFKPQIANYGVQACKQYQAITILARMGVVYSPEAVRDGKVPGPGAQAQAGKYLLDSLFKGNFENGIVAGMIYGSTAYGRATVRSDLDFLVLHDNALARIATDALRRQIVNVRDQFHVVVEPHISAAGHHTSLVDPLYEKHLEDVANQAREWTRNDPISHMRIIKATEKAVRRDATLYAKRKSVRFATISATAGERVDLVNLQRAFELPGSIGRKVTALYGMEKEGAALTDRPTLAGTALECLVAAGETSLTKSGVEAHTKLVELDATYTELLKRTMEDGDVAEYAQWLKDAYLTACQDAHVLAGAWLEVLYPDYPGDS